jgi:aldose 1-epimerase
MLRLDAALDTEGLTIATTLTATGDVPVPVDFGFHPYLRLPGVDRSRWQLGLPARRCLFTDVRGIPTGHREDERAARLRHGARSFDDGFADGAQFSVAGAGRRLTVTFVTGCPAAQIFSPRGAQFVCFEPMTARANALRSGDGLRRLAPGAAFTAVFRIAITGE